MTLSSTKRTDPPPLPLAVLIQSRHRMRVRNVLDCYYRLKSNRVGWFDALMRCFRAGWDRWNGCNRTRRTP
eukprot:5723182-Pyramimonas_sp.AAC.1